MAAKALKFLLFLVMLLLGATSVPRLLFLLFLLVTGGEIQDAVVKEVLTAFIGFVIATAAFVGVSGWLRKQDDIFT